jgi:hypothetical protein
MDKRPIKTVVDIKGTIKGHPSDMTDFFDEKYDEALHKELNTVLSEGGSLERRPSCEPKIPTLLALATLPTEAHTPYQRRAKGLRKLITDAIDNDSQLTDDEQLGYRILLGLEPGYTEMNLIDRWAASTRYLVLRRKARSKERRLVPFEDPVDPIKGESAAKRRRPEVLQKLLECLRRYLSAGRPRPGVPLDSSDLVHELDHLSNALHTQICALWIPGILLSNDFTPPPTLERQSIAVEVVDSLWRYAHILTGLHDLLERSEQDAVRGVGWSLDTYQPPYDHTELADLAALYRLAPRTRIEFLARLEESSRGRDLLTIWSEWFRSPDIIPFRIYLGLMSFLIGNEDWCGLNDFETLGKRTCHTENYLRFKDLGSQGVAALLNDLGDEETVVAHLVVNFVNLGERVVASRREMLSLLVEDWYGSIAVDALQ